MKKEKSVRAAEMKAAVIKQIKSLIFPMILCAILVAGLLVVLNYKEAEEVKEIIKVNEYDGGKEPIVMENDSLVFTMDPLTTQFTVKVKKTGKIWYSNPEGAEEDPLALATEQANMKSTLLMSYSQQAGLETIYNNYEYSIEKGIYEIEPKEDEIRVKYSIGKIEKTYIIPPVATQEKFESFSSQMDQMSQMLIQQFYLKYDINNLKKSDNKEELLEKYPILETEPIYVLSEGASSAVKSKLEVSFQEVGYTAEDFEEDRALTNVESTSDNPVFNVEVYYKLDGEDLVVSVPLSSLEYPEENPMYTLTLLPYFGAGGKEDEGYILVPEGGGAIINFNNGKENQSAYYANVYGWDMCLSRDAVVHNTRSYFNTFGIANGNDSFLCILEEGAPYASVQADISGNTKGMKANSYNTASAVYSINSRERYDVGDIANSAIYVYQSQLPDETLTQRYRFINTGDYSEMAKVYQGYLKDKYGDALTMNADTEAPSVIEIVGAVDKVRQVVGVPVSLPLELTTYKEAEAVIKELTDEGMKNMSVKLSGWSNGGVNQQLLKKVKTISDLGSKKDLQNMINTASSLGVDVYLDGVTHYAYDSNLLDGFFSYRDAAKFISKERAELFVYSAVTYSAREGVDSYYLLHADLALQMADNLAKAAKGYNAGVSFRETGKDLSSDFYQKNPTSRQTVLYRQTEQLTGLRKDGQKVMVNMGNDYAAVNSDVITNMDLVGTQYTILDDFVPFYQMALHGYVNYAGLPLNLSGNLQEELLKSAEYGAGLYFTIMKESAFTLQKTLYTEYYGADYDAIHDEMMSIYNRYNSELGHTFNQEMKSHQSLSEEVSCTTYEDGTKVYVNYGYAEFDAPGGVKIPARDYIVVR